MNKTQTQVRDFHKAFDILICDEPTFPTKDTIMLRDNLIEEEYHELQDAFARGDMVDIADAIGDLLYVTYGAAVSIGLDMEPIMDEIHRSNMSKVGGHKALNGKWIKPETYSTCDLLPILRAQGFTDEIDSSN